MKEINKKLRKRMELVKPPEEKTEEQQKMDAMVKEARKRAQQIVKQCAFNATPISDQAKQCCQTIEMLFDEVTTEIAMLLPGEYRTALCLEHLENACMWAKKAIAAHDHYRTALNNMKEEDGKPNN